MFCTLKSTVTRVYAVESAAPDLKENWDRKKVFINKEQLLLILRRNLQGKVSCHNEKNKKKTTC